MNPSLLLDVCGRARQVDGPGGTPRPLADLLARVQGVPVHVLTDWGQGAVFGVASVMATGRAAAALLEKQLRDQGETDEVSHMLVHRARAGMGSSELVYCAVPAQGWNRYQAMAAAHSCIVLLHDWSRSLLHWARAMRIRQGHLLVVHPDALDVLVIRDGEAAALTRLPRVDEGPQACERLGQRAAALVADMDMDGGAAEDAQVSAPRGVMWVCAGAEEGLMPLVRGLGPVKVDEMSAEHPDQVRLIRGNGSTVGLLDWQALVADLPAREAASPAIDVAATWAERWMPAFSAGAAALACAMAVGASVLHLRSYGEGSADAAALTPATWQTLNERVQQADREAAGRQAVRVALERRLAAAELPEFTTVLERLRQSLPVGVAIDEVGLVAEKGTHLVTVLGSADVRQESLRDESELARGLRASGFQLVDREVLVKDGRPKFKLSMTWSSS